MIQKLKLSRYYNKYSLVMFANGVQQFFGLATGFVLFHYLSPAQAGMYIFILSFVGLCEAGRNGFLSTATIKFYAGADNKRAATVLGSVWYLAIICTGIILAFNALALLLLPGTNNTEIILCIKWIGITYSSSLVTDVIFWRLQAEERYGKIFLLRMLNTISTITVFIVFILLHKFTLENALIINFLTNCFACIAGIFWKLSGFKSIVHRSKECITEISAYGKYTFGTYVISNLLGNADTWIVNFVLGPATVAIYSLATKFIGLADLPLRTFLTTGMSEMAIANNAKNMERVAYIFKKYTGMLTIGFVPFALISIILAGFLTRVYGGHNFDGAMAAEAATTYRVMMILAIVFPIDRFNGLALDIINKAKVNFHKVIIMLVVKVVAGFIFTEVLKNIYGIVVANYLMAITALFYGYYHLRKSIDYTIPGVISAGYAEMKQFLKKELHIIFRPKNIS